MKIFLAQPSNGTVDWQANGNRKDFVAYSVRWAIKHRHQLETGDTGRYVVHSAREDLADAALKHGATHLLWIDDDMVIPHNTLERLMPHMKKADIVCPLAFQRVVPFWPVIYEMEEKPQEDGRIDLRQVRMSTYPKNTLLQVDACGFGCVLMKTSILKTIPKPWFSSWTQIGEDIWFTYRATKHGFKVCCDTSFHVGHLADRPIIGEPQYEEFKSEGRVTCWDVGKDAVEEMLKQ